MRRRQFVTVLGCCIGWPFAARSEIKGHRIAIVHPAIPVSALTETGGSPIQVFFAELRRLGYVEGGNLAIDRYSVKGIPPAALGELANNVLSRAPDLIVTLTWYMVELLKQTTNAVPMVAMVNDPVAAGLTNTLARPGGNVTGVVRSLSF